MNNNYGLQRLPTANTEVVVQQEAVPAQLSIHKAFTFGLQIKERIYKSTSFPWFMPSVQRFKKWLRAKGYEGKPVSAIDRKTIIKYLNEMLSSTTPRTRNNARTDLSSLFKTLEDNDVVPENFIKKINVLNAKPEQHKTYSTTQLERIYGYMEQQDPLLLLFIKFVSYNYLRPIEVCRLRVEDVDVQGKRLFVKAKNSPVKIKIIPEILLRELPDLSHFNKTDALFTPTQLVGIWETNEKD